MKSYYKENFPFFLTFFINLLDHVSSSPCFPFEPLDRSLNYCSVRNIRKHHLFLSIQAAMAKDHKLGSYRQQIGEGNGTPLQYSCLKKSHRQRSLVGCSPWGREKSDTTERLPFHFSLSCIGEGNGNPLQCSCLENLRDGGAW